MKKLITLLSIFCIGTISATCLKNRVIQLEKKVRTLAGSERDSWNRIEKMYKKVLGIERQLPALTTKKLRVIEVEDGTNDNK